MTFESFTNDLKNLSANKKEIKRLKTKYNAQFYSLTGVKGCDPSKSGGNNPNDEFIAQIRLDKIDKLDELEHEIERLEKTVDRTSKTLEYQDMPEIYIDLYVKKMKQKIAAEKYLFSSATEMIRYLKKTYRDFL